MDNDEMTDLCSSTMMMEFYEFDRMNSGFWLIVGAIGGAALMLCLICCSWCVYQCCRRSAKKHTGAYILSTEQEIPSAAEATLLDTRSETFVTIVENQEQDKVTAFGSTTNVADIGTESTEQKKGEDPVINTTNESADTSSRSTDKLVEVSIPSIPSGLSGIDGGGNKENEEQQITVSTVSTSVPEPTSSNTTDTNTKSVKFAVPIIVIPEVKGDSTATPTQHTNSTPTIPPVVTTPSEAPPTSSGGTAAMSSTSQSSPSTMTDTTPKVLDVTSTAITPVSQPDEPTKVETSKPVATPSPADNAPTASIATDEADKKPDDSLDNLFKNILDFSLPVSSSAVAGNTVGVATVDNKVETSIEL